MENVVSSFIVKTTSSIVIPSPAPSTVAPDRYSRLTCTNDAGIDKVYYFQVKPYPKYFPGINRYADYIVEFRR